MITLKKSLTLSLAIIVLMYGVFFTALTVYGVDMNDNQLSLIKNSCSSVKATLIQLHNSDALLRVNRGQIYESMSTKLIGKFNNRIESNNLTYIPITDATNSYHSLLDKFRADYIIYEEQLSASIDIDCSKQPVAFYDAVALSRVDRNQVHADITNLNQSISQYKTALDGFELMFQTNLQGLKK